MSANTQEVFIKHFMFPACHMRKGIRNLHSTYRAALAIPAAVPVAELAGECLIGLEDVVDATDLVTLSGWASRAGDGDGSEKGR